MNVIDGAQTICLRQNQSQIQYRMKGKQLQKHLQLFQREFIHNQNINNTQQPVLQQRNTEQNILDNYDLPQRMPESMLILNKPVQQGERIQEQEMRKRKRSTRRISNADLRAKLTNRKYKIMPQFIAVEIVVAYALTIGTMYLTKVVVQYPFFQALIVIIIALSTQPFNLTSSFIMLGIPMTVANYNLGTWVLSYPQTVICYLSYYIFSDRNFKKLLWIVVSVLYMLFGFIVLPGIAGALGKEFRFVLYYLYPWMLILVRLLSGLLTGFIQASHLFLMPISMFLSGLSYGMLMTLSVSSIEFWYMLVLLTLDVVNSRYQFLLIMLKKLLRIKLQPYSIVQAECSGYVALHSFHIIIFVYTICALGLNSPHFTYNLQVYLVTEKYKAAIIWIFLSTYEIICLVKLRNREDLLIVGYADYRYLRIAARVLVMGMGLWFFFLGLGIPSDIFLLA